MSPGWFGYSQRTGFPDASVVSVQVCSWIAPVASAAGYPGFPGITCRLVPLAPLGENAFVSIARALAEGKKEYPFVVSQVPSAFTMLHMWSSCKKRSFFPDVAPGSDTQEGSVV